MRDGSCAPTWRNSTARNGAYSAVLPCARDLVEPVRRVGRIPGSDGVPKARDGHDEPEPAERQQPEDGRAHERDGMDRHGTPGVSGNAPYLRRSYSPPARAAIAETRSVAGRRRAFHARVPARIAAAPRRTKSVHRPAARPRGPARRRFLPRGLRRAPRANVTPRRRAPSRRGARCRASRARALHRRISVVDALGSPLRRTTLILNGVRPDNRALRETPP